MTFWDTNGSLNLDHTTKPNDSQQKKGTCLIGDFVFPADLRVKLKESKKRNKFSDIDFEMKKQWNMTGYSQQRISKGTGGFENMWMCRDHPNYSSIKISQNTEKSPGDLKRLAVTQTQVKDHQLTVVWKTQRSKMKIIFTNPSFREGYDTRSIFKRSLTGLNSEFSFSYTSCLIKAEELSQSDYLPIERE